MGRISLQKRQIDLQQERLRQKQQEFETISENMAEGLVLLDGRGYVLAINQSALKRLRMDGKKALGGTPIPKPGAGLPRRRPTGRWRAPMRS